MMIGSHAVREDVRHSRRPRRPRHHRCSSLRPIRRRRAPRERDQHDAGERVAIAFASTQGDPSAPASALGCRRQVQHGVQPGASGVAETSAAATPDPESQVCASGSGSAKLARRPDPGTFSRSRFARFARRSWSLTVGAPESPETPCHPRRDRERTWPRQMGLPGAVHPRGRVRSRDHAAATRHHHTPLLPRTRASPPPPPPAAAPPCAGPCSQRGRTSAASKATSQAAPAPCTAPGVGEQSPPGLPRTRQRPQRRTDWRGRPRRRATSSIAARPEVGLVIHARST